MTLETLIRSKSCTSIPQCGILNYRLVSLSDDRTLASMCLRSASSFAFGDLHRLTSSWGLQSEFKYLREIKEEWGKWKKIKARSSQKKSRLLWNGFRVIEKKENHEPCSKDATSLLLNNRHCMHKLTWRGLWLVLVYVSALPRPAIRRISCLQED